jgi:hypothetical protein
MLQESTSGAWDLRTIYAEPSGSTKIYVLFVFVVFIVTSIKLMKVWRAAPPFRLSRRAQNPIFLEFLQRSATSLKQWIGFTFIGWGIYASMSLYHLCNELLALKSLAGFIVLYDIGEFVTGLTMALLVVLFAFLARWHIVKRIERLSNS